jgi:hypothetical protein
MSPSLTNRLAPALVAFAAGLSLAGAADVAGFEFFEKKVRPILVERCYACHGEEKQKGGLRLDHRAGALHGGDSGPVLVPGEPEKSLLARALSWDDPKLQMPPRNRLPDAEIAVLTDWIRRGAPDPREVTTAAANPMAAGPHWAYQPLQAASPPAVRDQAWPANDLDRFILARLEAKGLRPVGDADQATLARRLFFALTGLPPAPEDIDQFVHDDRPEALAALVDSLLASPHFGERWGRHWLDIVRFGESVTLRGFIFPEAWRYRDYVIDAFNEDRPYDQFLREQIAGDLLPASSLAERQRQVIATTFLALGNTNFEEQDKQQLEMDFIDEQLDTLGKAFLAQTIGCARCHDHKFDPIPARDYYALAGILRNATAIEHANVSKWVELPLPLEPDEEARVNAHETEVKRLTAAVATAKDRLAKLQTAGDQPTTPNVLAVADLPGIVVDSAQAGRVGEWQLSQHTGRFIGDGYLHDQNRDKGRKTLTFHPALPASGRYEVRFAFSHDGSRATNVPVTILHADGETTVLVNQRERPPIDGRFVSLGQFRFERGNQGSVLVSNEGTGNFVTADAIQFLPPPGTFGGENVATTDAAPEPGVSAGEQAALAAARTELAQLEAQLKTRRAAAVKRPMVMGIRENPTVGDIPIHIRGSVHNLGALAPRGFLQIASHGAVPVIPENESGRQQLADWLASPDNPLTARVLVNRVWHWLFGAGLVRSPDNFGTTGDAPSHPELLDHLAAEFIADGWSVKQLLRRMVLSRTYGLSTADDAAALAADPENRLLWRMNRRRLEAENVRDAILSASGRLDLTTGGSTVPTGLSSDYDVRYTGLRRSVYVPVLRNSLPELFEVFDFADPSMVVGARHTSTVAPQALFLLNHPFVMEEARHTAERLLREAGANATDQIQLLYRLTLGRPPTEAELQLATHFLAYAETEPTEALAQLAQALFASLDFRHVR